MEKRRSGEVEKRTARQRARRIIPVPVANETEGDESDEVFSSGLSDDDAMVPRGSGARPLDRTISAKPSVGHISERTRRQIRSGEYVSIGSLLPKDDDEDERTDRRYTIDEETGTFRVVEGRQKLSLARWTDGFINYMAVRMESTPGEGLALLSHCQQIRDFVCQGKDGIRYDKKFRQLKAQQPRLNWGDYRGELLRDFPRAPVWREARSGGLAQFQRRVSPPRSSVLLCFQFNSARGCTRSPCRYKHSCDRCGSPGHPSYHCEGSRLTRPRW